jgi:hypothetical protein
MKQTDLQEVSYAWLGRLGKTQDDDFNRKIRDVRND